jgi:hypothetical protein
VWVLTRLADWHQTDDHGFTEAVDRVAERLIENSWDLSAGRHAAQV